MPTFRSAAIQAPLCFHVPKMLCGRTANAVAAAIGQLDATASLGIDLPMRLIEVEPMKAEPAATYCEAQGEERFGTLRQWPSELAHMLAEQFDAFFGPGARNEPDASMTVPVLAPLPVL